MSRSRWSIIAVLVVIGFGLYAPNLGNPLFWDDADWITLNPRVQELSINNLSFIFSHDVLAGIGGSSNYYRPFLMLTFALNWALGGENPVGYHLVSNGLHVLNSVLIYLLLSRLFRDSSFGFRVSRIAPAIAALFWLIHPLQTEAVTYISGRGDPLSVTLMFAAILLYLRSSALGFRAWCLGFALLLAALAILSRETAVLLPGYLMLVLMAFRYGTRGPRGEPVEPFWPAVAKSLRDAWPFLALSGFYGLLRVTALDFANTLNWYKASNAYTGNVEVRIWTFLQVLWEYLRLAVVPVGLHMERSVPVLTAPWQFPAYLGLFALILALWWVVRAWRRGNRLPFFGVGMFLLPLIPSSGILAPINALIYEHWLYLSLLGFAVLVAVYGVRLYDWLAASKKAEVRMAKYVLLALVISHLSFLAIQTIRRNLIWGNPERLYLQILQYEPQNVRVLNNLANLYADRGDLVRDEEYLRRAMEADPAQPAPYHNLANLMRDRGEANAAIELYVQAINTDSSFHWAYRNLTALLLEQDRYAEALQVVVSFRGRFPGDPVMEDVYRQLTSQP